MSPVWLQAVQDGLLGSLAQFAGIAASLVLVLILVALGSYAYKQLYGGGVEWPDEEDIEDDGVRRGDNDDEWDYY